MKKLQDFLCVDNISGEEFFVECETREQAKEILRENDFDLNEIEWCGTYDPAIAEQIGLDTYQKRMATRVAVFIFRGITSKKEDLFYLVNCDIIVLSKRKVKTMFIELNGYLFNANKINMVIGPNEDNPKGIEIYLSTKPERIEWIEFSSKEAAQTAYNFLLRKLEEAQEF